MSEHEVLGCRTKEDGTTEFLIGVPNDRNFTQSARTRNQAAHTESFTSNYGADLRRNRAGVSTGGRYGYTKLVS